MRGHGLDSSGRTGISDRLLWSLWWTFGFCKMWGISPETLSVCAARLHQCISYDMHIHIHFHAVFNIVQWMLQCQVQDDVDRSVNWWLTERHITFHCSINWQHPALITRVQTVIIGVLLVLFRLCAYHIMYKNLAFDGMFNTNQTSHL